MEKAYRTKITGVVQGVGFRPFVYHLAVKRQLRGFVMNTTEGVTLEVEGKEEDLEEFFKDIFRYKPPLARIVSLKKESIELNHRTSFRILESDKALENSALISPDMAICEDCLRELLDPNDRRYLYPFINCTNCGPRFTIIQDLPYDRMNTTMAVFKMCKECEAEYHNPISRRFHAQPNACKRCGPIVWLEDSEGHRIESLDPIGNARQLIAEGFILAVKGLGGFHLVADATQEEAVLRLRLRKNRDEKPFAIMVKDMEELREICVVNKREVSLLLSQERPILLLRKRKGQGLISEGVAPNNQFFGVMLPYTPLHYLLLSRPLRAIVATSGNISEEPISKTNEEALTKLRGIADYYLLHDREIHQRADDSVVKVMAGKATFIRRARGYAPMPIFLNSDLKGLPKALGVGGEIKNTFCLLRQNQAFLSQHIGDMENLETFEYYLSALQDLKRLLSIEPEVIGYDLHPMYLSTRYALETPNIPKVAVQHHHAHIVSCMAENGEIEPVIGVALDGTGYGTDGTIWGGEILISDLKGFKRAAHLEPVHIISSDTTVKYPWKTALALLVRSFGDHTLEIARELFIGLGKSELEITFNSLKNRFNTVLCSSTGRLFDGIAALLGIRMKNAFEGQAPMELEMSQSRERTPIYETQVERVGEKFLLKTSPIVEGVIADLRDGRSKNYIARRFHLSLVQLLVKGVKEVAFISGLRKVALSGGSFQNATLFSRVQRELKKAGFQVLTHSSVPPNDGGLSLGQAVCAAATLAGDGDGLHRGLF